MKRHHPRRLWLLLSSAILLMTPSVSPAGPLLDWLLGRPSVVPVTAYYPGVTANYAGTASPGASCGPAQCEQTVVRYLPETAYRTVWQPVPVTTYRRTVSYNPTTGLPITCTQPCTTYTYQARRVPYTTWRPVYTTEPVTAAVAPANCACAAAPASTALPGYSTPAYTTPGSTAPSPSADPPGATPWQPVPQAGAAVPGATTPGAGAPSGTGDPADVRPRLDGAYQSSSPSVRKLPTTSPPAQRPPQGAPAPPAADTPGVRSLNRYDQDYSNDSFRSENNSQGNDPVDNGSGASMLNSPIGPITPEDSAHDLRPLPNLDRYPAAQDGRTSPRVLNPRHRTAFRPIPTRWASNRIAWSDVSSAPVRQAVAVEPAERSNNEVHLRPLPTQRSSRWDDSGWRSSAR